MPFQKSHATPMGGEAAYPDTTTSIGELAMARLVAVAFAGVMLFTVAIVSTPAIHNFAHDTRHTQAFPCH